jgi:hypothetical protein
MNLDAYMDDFGRDLARATRTRRRRARVLLALPAGAAAALAVALIPTSRGIDAIAEAREALSPNGEIVHMKIEITTPNLGGPTEQWYTADPARWRLIYTVPEHRAGVAGPIEVSYSGDRLRQYVPERDVATIYTGIPDVKHLTPGLAGGDPTTEVRDQLATGDIDDDGVVTVAGRAVRRLVATTKTGHFTRRLVYYMDPKTFAPVGGRESFQGPRGAPLEVAFKITGYERMPLNDETAKLLDIHHTDRTKFIWKDLTRSPAKPSRAIKKK